MFKKKILPIIVFVLLFAGMAFFPYIPMELFKIPYESFNMTMKAIYMIVFRQLKDFYIIVVIGRLILLLKQRKKRKEKCLLQTVTMLKV